MSFSTSLPQSYLVTLSAILETIRGTVAFRTAAESKRKRPDVVAEATERMTAVGFARSILYILHPTLEYEAIQITLLLMPILIITEKTSQAHDRRAALGDRFGQILPAEGHLLRLAEPHEVEASWKNWECVLLKPDGLRAVPKCVRR